MTNTAPNRRWIWCFFLVFGTALLGACGKDTSPSKAAPEAASAAAGGDGVEPAAGGARDVATSSGERKAAAGSPTSDGTDEREALGAAGSHVETMGGAAGAPRTGGQAGTGASVREGGSAAANTYSCDCSCSCEGCTTNTLATGSPFSTCEALCNDTCQKVECGFSTSPGTGTCTPEYNPSMSGGADDCAGGCPSGEECVPPTGDAVETSCQPVGGLDQPCPEYEPCQSGLACANDGTARGRCIASGGALQPCASGTCGEPGLHCLYSSDCPVAERGQPYGSARCCLPEGAEWMPCGAGDTCDSGLTCAASSDCPTSQSFAGVTLSRCCLHAGVRGQPCNSDGTCNDPNLACRNQGEGSQAVKICKEAGGLSRACRPDNGCDSGLVCATDAMLCSLDDYPCCVRLAQQGEACGQSATAQCASLLVCSGYGSSSGTCEAASTGGAGGSTGTGAGGRPGIGTGGAAGTGGAPTTGGAGAAAGTGGTTVVVSDLGEACVLPSDQCPSNADWCQYDVMTCDSELCVGSPSAGYCSKPCFSNDDCAGGAVPMTCLTSCAVTGWGRVGYCWDTATYEVLSKMC